MMTSREPKEDSALVRLALASSVQSLGRRVELSNNNDLQALRQALDNAAAARNAAEAERAALQSQCTAAVRAWNNVVGENQELKEQLTKVQAQRDKALVDAQTSALQRIKATKDLARLTEERNAVVQEYNNVMSERDAVHKELDRLGDELSASRAREERLERERRALSEELEALRRPSPARLDGRWQHCSALSAASSASSVFSGESEAMKRQVDRLTRELLEAQQEAEVARRRRDWAFDERDKIVLERESIRKLCDKLRRERDRAVSELAEALRDGDDVKRQRNEAVRQLQMLQERQADDRSSRDSAIDISEDDTQLLEVRVRREADSTMTGFGQTTLMFGFELSESSLRPTVERVLRGRELRSGDVLVRVEGRAVNDARSALTLMEQQSSELRLTVQRKKRFESASELGQALGVTLTCGLFVSRIAPGSALARAGRVSVGDRVVAVNGRAVELNTPLEWQRLLESEAATLTVLEARATVERRKRMISSACQTEEARSDRKLLDRLSARLFHRKKSSERAALAELDKVLEQFQSGRRRSGGTWPRLSERSARPTIELLRRPESARARSIVVERGAEPLGIQIAALEEGGVCVSSVVVGSAAAAAGLQVGDQLLEVCGINLRSATYTLAAHVLRQCGPSIRMLVAAPEAEVDCL